MISYPLRGADDGRAAVSARHGDDDRGRRPHPQQGQRRASLLAGLGLYKDGLPSTDPLEAREKGGFLTSLGGSPENSSYKGYGLAAMVNILASCPLTSTTCGCRMRTTCNGFT